MTNIIAVAAGDQLQARQMLVSITRFTGHFRRNRVPNDASAEIAYFATVFAIGFALGVARVLVLAPQLGELRSVLVELPFILSASWIICGYLIGRYSVSDDWRFRALMGGTALVLLMLAELALSVLIFGRSIEAHLEAYQSLGAVVGLAGQIGFALLPMLRKMRSR